MSPQEVEALIVFFLPYFGVGLVVAIFMSWLLRPKKQTITACPLPSQVILDELKVLLTDAFEKPNKEAFLREASKLYDTRSTLTRKI